MECLIAIELMLHGILYSHEHYNSFTHTKASGLIANA